ncbi:hypothetical protein [Bacillus sp. 1P06AnD]|uniref:hypothetical protein n=1 Tax=Bacillus sp. 1P06AnD TaxID=3132208 RepID=UPI0039A3CDBF
MKKLIIILCTMMVLSGCHWISYSDDLSYEEVNLYKTNKSILEFVASKQESNGAYIWDTEDGKLYVLLTGIQVDADGLTRTYTDVSISSEKNVLKVSFKEKKTGPSQEDKEKTQRLFKLYLDQSYPNISVEKNGRKSAYTLASKEND